MSTPTAKRRRVDAANATLRKPFQSPMIRRPASADGTPKPETDSSRVDEVYSPSSPSVPRQLGPLRQTRPAPSLLKLSKTPPGSARLGSRRKPSEAHARAIGTIGADDDDDDDADADVACDSENPFMALVKSHRMAGLDTMIKGVDQQLETVRQAKKIEDASERKNPREPVDQELRNLVAKWRGASRLAADELFEMVKKRVDSSGGPKAWKAMQQRQMEFYRGFDQDSPTRSKTAGNHDDEEHYAHDEVESSLEKEQRLQGNGRAKGKSDEDEEQTVCYPFVLYSVLITNLFSRSSTSQ